VTVLWTEVVVLNGIVANAVPTGGVLSQDYLVGGK
jgi:hypothetical protein